jgi:NAD(P)-dependent dehydrogenase (short-subunit alcohol dehydrogenase family)
MPPNDTDKAAGVCPFTGRRLDDPAVAMPPARGATPSGLTVGSTLAPYVPPFGPAFARDPVQDGRADGPRTLLLTGASRGIGHATVKRFASAGWRVLTVSRHAFPEGACPWPGGERDHVQLDLGNLAAIGDAVAEVRDRLGNGRLDALVNNAGISPKGPEQSRLGVLESDATVWQQVMGVNLISTALLARGLFAELRAAQGAIVNVTSIAGTRVHPYAGVAYACSKAALAALTREMAHDFGRYGVRVNAIAPGEINTSILSPGTDEMVQREVPMGRLGTTAEVAETIFFLCTAGASYVNGAEIHINGGQHV